MSKESKSDEIKEFKERMEKEKSRKNESTENEDKEIDAIKKEYEVENKDKQEEEVLTKNDNLEERKKFIQKNFGEEMFKNYMIGKDVIEPGDNNLKEFFESPQYHWNTRKIIKSDTKSFQSTEQQRGVNEFYDLSDFSSEHKFKPSFLKGLGLTANFSARKTESRGKIHDSHGNQRVWSSYLAIQMMSCKIDKQSLVFTDKLLEKFDYLLRAKKNELENFEEILREFEKSVSMINLGPFYLGGIHKIMVDQAKADEHDFEIENKNESNKKEFNFGSENKLTHFELDAILSYKQEKSDKMQNETTETTKSKHIKLDLELCGYGPKDIPGFQRSIERSFKNWKIIGNEPNLIYIADLLNLKGNIELLFNKGHSMSEIRELKNSMFANFKSKASFIRPLISDDSKQFENSKCLKPFQEYFKDNIREGKPTNKKIIIKFINDIFNLQINYPSTFKSLRESFLNKKDLKLFFEKIIEITHLETDKDKSSNDLKILEENEMLLDQVKMLWDMPRIDKFDVVLSSELRKLYKIMSRKNLEFRETIKSIKNKNDSFGSRFFKWGFDVVDYIDEFVQFYEGKSLPNVTAFFNKILSQIKEKSEINQLNPYKTTMALCLLELVDFSFVKFQIIGDVELSTVKEFMESYQDRVQDEDFFAIFEPDKRQMRNNRLLKFVQSKALEVRRKAQKNPEDSARLRDKKIRYLEFFIHLSRNKNYEFSDDDIFVFFCNFNENLILYKPEDHLRKSNSIFKALHSDSNEAKSESQVNSRPPVTRILEKCQRVLGHNISKITFAQAVALRNCTTQPAEVPSEGPPRAKIDWEAILEQILLQKALVDLECEPCLIFEQILAIYYLADNRLNQIIANYLLSAKLPIPFLYADNSCVLSPICSLSVEYSNYLDQVKIANPYFHKSLKVLVMQTHPVEDQLIERLALKCLGHDGEPREYLKYFACSGRGELTEKTITIHFLTNLNQEDSKSAHELSMLLMNKASIARRQLNPSELCALELVDCVILLLKKENDLETLDDRIKALLDSSPGKCLVRVLDSELDEDTQSANSDDVLDREFPEIQRLLRSVLPGNLKSLHKIFSNQGEPSQEPAKTRDPAKSDSRSYKFPRSRVFVKIDLLMTKIASKIQSSQNGSILKLDKFYEKKYLNFRQNRLIIKSTNTFQIDFLLNKWKSKIDQNRHNRFLHLCNLDGDSPITVFCETMFQFSPSNRVLYLLYLDQSLANMGFKVEEIAGSPIRVKCFLRELTQIYEVLSNYIADVSRIRGAVDELLRFCGEPSVKLRVNKFFRNHYKERVGSLQRSVDQIPKLFANLLRNLYPIEIFNDTLDKFSMRFLRVIFEQLSRDLDYKTFRTISIVDFISSKKLKLLKLFDMNLRPSQDKGTEGSRMIMVPVRTRQYDISTVDYVVFIRTYLSSKRETEQTSRPNRILEKQLQIRENKMMLINSELSDLIVFNSHKHFPKRIFIILALMIYWMVKLKHCSTDTVIKFMLDGVEPGDRELRQWKSTIIENLMEKTKEFNQIKENQYLEQSIEFSDVFTFDEKRGAEILDRSAKMNLMQQLWSIFCTVSAEKEELSSQILSTEDFVSKIGKLKILLSHQKDMFEIEKLADFELKKKKAEQMKQLETRIEGLLKKLNGNGSIEDFGDKCLLEEKKEVGTQEDDLKLTLDGDFYREIQVLMAEMDGLNQREKRKVFEKTVNKYDRRLKKGALLRRIRSKRRELMSIKDENEFLKHVTNEKSRMVDMINEFFDYSEEVEEFFDQVKDTYLYPIMINKNFIKPGQMLKLNDISEAHFNEFNSQFSDYFKIDSFQNGIKNELDFFRIDSENPEPDFWGFKNNLSQRVKLILDDFSKQSTSTIIPWLNISKVFVLNKIGKNQIADFYAFKLVNTLKVYIDFCNEQKAVCEQKNLHFIDEMKNVVQKQSNFVKREEFLRFLSCRFVKHFSDEFCKEADSKFLEEIKNKKGFFNPKTMIKKIKVKFLRESFVLFKYKYKILKSSNDLVSQKISKVSPMIHEMINSFIANLKDFGTDFSKYVLNYIQTNLKALKSQFIKLEMKNYQKTIKSQLIELKSILLTCKTENEVNNQLQELLSISVLNKLKTGDLVKTISKKDLEENGVLKESEIISKINEKIHIANDEEIKMTLHKEHDDLCNFRCFICGARCGKKKDHELNDEDKLHYSPIHLPTIYLSMYTF